MMLIFKVLLMLYSYFLVFTKRLSVAYKKAFFSSISQHYVEVVLFILFLLLTMSTPALEGWKSVLIAPGEQFVISFGTMKMPV